MSVTESTFKSDRLLAELEAHICDVMTADELIPEEQAQRVATLVAERIWMTWGGQQIYVSKQQPHLQRRNEQIAQAFDGDVDNLCRTFGLSRARIYAILKQQRGHRRR